MFYDAIEKAPLWYQDYSMSGLQWGTKQLFQEAIPEYVSKNPEKKIKVSSTWSNGTDIFIRFFNLGPNVEIGHINEFLHATEKLDQNITFIMTKEEYLRAQTSKKFKSVLPEKTLQYPNGSDAFYFVSNLEYVDNISQILQMEKEEKNRLVEEVVKYNGETIQVKHSLLDSGSAKNLFDNNIETIIKGQEANPFILEVIFPYPKEIKNITLNLQNINVDWKAVLFTYTNKQVEYTGHYNFEPNSFYTKLELTFDQGPEKISKIYLAIKNSNLGEIANIHLYDLIL